MLESVTVTVPARLHLGFLDIDGALGRRFGSIGVALDRPFTRLSLSRAERTVVTGPDGKRAGAHLKTICTHLGITDTHRLNVEAAIPRHAGLGSGTQLALAVATAVRRLHAMNADFRADAELLGRGNRSGVGIGLFSHGGVVVDGGRRPDGGPPPIVARLPFPEEWRILLLRDCTKTGVHGEHEVEAFAGLPPFSEEAAARLCHLALMQALPALVEQDLDAFGAAISAIQCAVGDHFAPAQGGRFASRSVAAALELLAREGVSGRGQSSWGPTGFAFAADVGEASILKSRIAADPGFRDLQVEIVRGNNRGASSTAERIAPVS